MPPAAAADMACCGVGSASTAGGIIRVLLLCSNGCCITDGRGAGMRLAPAKAPSGAGAAAALQGGC